CDGKNRLGLRKCQGPKPKDYICHRDRLWKRRPLGEKARTGSIGAIHIWTFLVVWKRRRWAGTFRLGGNRYVLCYPPYTRYISCSIETLPYRGRRIGGS